MRRPYVFNTIAVAVVLLFSAMLVSAQTEQMRGSVKIVGADGNPTPVVGAVVDVYRTDMKSDYHTKTDKKGDWVFAGLPFVGTYTVTASAPGASPSARGNVKARADQPIEIVLSPGDGKKLTEAEAVAAGKPGSAPTAGGNGGGGGGDSAAEKAKAEAAAKQNAEIIEANKKVDNSNKIVGDAFKNGNAALLAKNYDEAIKQYDSGLAADPEHPGAPSLLTNKSVALRTRAVDRYNAAITSKDDAAKTAGIAAAKEDFSAAADAASKAVELVRKQPAGTDPAEQKQHETNKYYALAARAEAMRLFAMKVDQTKGAEAATAFGEYEAVETDAAKKTKAEKDYAELLFQTSSDQPGYEKAIAEFQKILEKNPDDTDALLRVGQALFNVGALSNNEMTKAKYQEASNYLQRYVDKAPEGQMKSEAKDLIAAMKQQANVTPEKTPARPPQKKRP
jgi:tetratricopeptide (TPR) repeat protein